MYFIVVRWLSHFCHHEAEEAPDPMRLASQRLCVIDQIEININYH